MDDDTTIGFVPGAENEEDAARADEPETPPTPEPEPEAPADDMPSLDIAPSIKEDPNLF